MPKPRRNKKRGAGNGAAPQQKTQKTAQPTSDKPPQIATEVNSRDQAVVRRLIEEPRISDSALAREFGIDRQTVARIKAKPAVKSVIAFMLQSTMELLVDAKREAARKLRPLMNSQDERIRARVVLGVLQIDPASAANDNAPRPDGSGQIKVIFENEALLADEEPQEQQPSKSDSISQPLTTENPTPASDSSTAPAKSSRDTADP